MATLKRCPFCGGVAKLITDNNGAYKIFCIEDKCEAQYGWGINRDFIIKGWNKRVKRGRRK